LDFYGVFAIGSALIITISPHFKCRTVDVAGHI